MFELLKKWFKRPVVVNLMVKPLSSGSDINIVKTDSHLTPEAIEAFHKAWVDFVKVEAIVPCSAVTLEQLTDEQLKAANITISNPARFNSGVAKYLKNSAERKR